MDMENRLTLTLAGIELQSELAISFGSGYLSDEPKESGKCLRIAEF